MDDTALDALLTEACSTATGAVRASYVMADLQKLAPIYYDEETRPVAEAAIAQWQAGADPLRKGISAAWLARATHALGRTGGKAAIGAVKGRIAGVTQKVENAGAKIGEKIAGHTRGNAAAQNAGGMAAEGKMRASLQPHAGGAGTHPRQMLEQGGAHRLSAEQNTDPRMRGQQTDRGANTQPHFQSQGRQPMAMDARRAMVHSDAMAGAYKSGAAQANKAHLAGAARQGRVVARHAFHAGLTVGGVGAVAAGSGLASRMSNSGGAQQGSAQGQQIAGNATGGTGPHHRGRGQGGGEFTKRYTDPRKARMRMAAVSRMMRVSRHPLSEDGERQQHGSGLPGLQSEGGFVGVVA